MATWTLRTAEGTREGLTIYQLQELIRSGQAGARDEVSQGGPWKRIDELPSLARFLSETSAPTSGPALVEHTQVVGTLRLELGPDGKPKPPPPELVAQMLALDSDRPKQERSRRLWRVVMVVGALLLAVETVLLVRAILHPPEHGAQGAPVEDEE